MNLLDRLFHRIEHAFGFNRGNLIVGTDTEGRTLVEFTCSTCGEKRWFHA